MDGKIKIREAVSSDITELVGLLRDLFSIEADFRFDEQKQRAGLLMLIESDCNEKVLFVAEKDKRVIGMCSAQTLISTAEGGKAAMIEDMVIEKSARGNGIGRLIMDEVTSWAEENGITRLQLLADKNNIRAISFYKKNDWKDTQLICLRRTGV